MVAPISFGSTFRLTGNSERESSVKYDKLLSYSQGLADNDNRVQIAYEDSKSPIYGWEGTMTVVVPDSLDKKVDSFCSRNGIYPEVIKSTNKMIEDRIEEPKNGTRMVRVNSKKLYEILKTQDSNIIECQQDYDDNHKDAVSFMLKSGDKIPATTLKISASNNTDDSVLNYIYKHGGLKDGMLNIDFIPQTESPDYCVYFGLKKLGIKEVPVYVDNTTYEIGKELGLFTD